MYRPNFCVECGERMTRQGWRAWLNSPFCVDCGRRLGKMGWVKPIVVIALVAVSAFAAGRFFRPPNPPLIVQRAANSPLSDLPVSLTDGSRTTGPKETTATNPNVDVSKVDEPGYICGARTKKGTPCHRRVHVAGERCFQHKGLPAMVPLEKLVVKSK
ncbi:MAG TPA: hypothetical protein VK475_01975 [Pyrinomonadaceae bacterium]|nr:hypothetical protein [Pyrinomonadaceae bacterium]